jgi:hypothetical protein
MPEVSSKEGRDVTKFHLSLAVALLTLPSVALAQSSPLVYLCTPDGQILKVNGTTATVILSGGGAFDDCVLGPDGRLYVSEVVAGDPAPNRIERVNPAPVSGSPTLERIATLPSAPRGLAFNISTLFITTASSGVYMLPGISLNQGPPYPQPAQVLSSPTTSGRGLVFDVPGNLVFATGGAVRSATPSAYTGPPLPSTGSTILASGLTPQGIAVNTCREIVLADKTSQSLQRIVTNGNSTSLVKLLTLSKKAFPTAAEIDLGNHIYFLSAEDDSGTNAILWRADPPAKTPLAQSCRTATITPLLDFKASLTGGSATIPGLLSSRAKGLAVGVSSVAITHTFSGECGFAYDFGYHVLTYTFGAPCSAASGITIDVATYKSRFADVTFLTPPFAASPATWALRESSMGGFAVQQVLTATANNQTLSVLPQYLQTYAFNTQETLYNPGVARRAEHGLSLPFDQNITSDVWNVDPIIGVRGIGGSKHTLFNSGLSKNCVLDAVFQEPLNSNNPLFNGTQTLGIRIGAKDAAGNPCDGGTLHVSLMRRGDVGCQEGPFEPQPVTSSTQTDNVMSALGKGKYGYNLDLLPVNTTGAEVTPAQFVITVWGDIAVPKNQLFRVEKSSR